MNRIIIAKKLIKIAKEIIAYRNYSTSNRGVCIFPDKYKGFSGEIDFGDELNGMVKNGNFEVTGTKNNYFIEWDGGIFEKGIWTNGNFNDGIFKSGAKWNGGNFNGGRFNGIFRKGKWNDGILEQGNFVLDEWNNGTFSGSIWNGKTWNDGKFAKGVFSGGIWKKGDFLGGVFQGEKWLGGTFKNGLWLASSAAWKGGVWEGGFDADRNYHEKGEDPTKWNAEKYAEELLIEMFGGDVTEKMIKKYISNLDFDEKLYGIKKTFEEKDIIKLLQSILYRKKEEKERNNPDKKLNKRKDDSYRGYNQKRRY